jgi:hypothetical protein
MNGVGENVGITIETPFRLKSHEKYPIKWKEKKISPTKYPILSLLFLCLFVCLFKIEVFKYIVTTNPEPTTPNFISL